MDREIIIETAEETPTKSPTEIKVAINRKIADTSAHLIYARKSYNNNYFFEARLDTPTSKVIEYKQEIEEALRVLDVSFISVRINTKWSKFIIHSIPTSIGEGREAGMLVATEIQSIYGEKFVLAQIPRWLS